MATKNQIQTLTNQATTTATPSSVDVSAASHIMVMAVIDVVGSPTSAAVVLVEASPDGGTTWVEVGSMSAGVTEGAYNLSLPINPAFPMIRTPFIAQTGGISSTANVWVLTME